MDSERTWKWTERCILVIGGVCGLVTTGYTVGLFYGWDKHEAAKVDPIALPKGAAMSMQWPIIALGALAALALLTAWAMIFIRLRAKKSSAISQEFIPRGSLISLNEIEFNVGRLSQAAPWLELYLTFSNATGYDAYSVSVTGRVTVSGQEFRDHIELANAITSFGSAPFFRMGLKVPLSTSEAEYCLNSIRRKNLLLAFPDSTVTFGIAIHDGKSRAAPLIYAQLPKAVHINPETLRSDPYIPWLFPYR